MPFTVYLQQQKLDFVVKFILLILLIQEKAIRLPGTLKSSPKKDAPRPHRKHNPNYLKSHLPFKAHRL